MNPYPEQTAANAATPWLRGGPAVDVDLDGLREYAQLLVSQQADIAARAGYLAPLGQMPGAAFNGDVLGEADAVRAGLQANAAELSVYLGKLAESLGNVAHAARTIAESYRTGDAIAAASLNDVLFAFGDKGVPRPAGLPEDVGVTYSDVVSSSSGSGVSGTGIADVTAPGSAGSAAGTPGSGAAGVSDPGVPGVGAAGASSPGAAGVGAAGVGTGGVGTGGVGAPGVGAAGVGAAGVGAAGVGAAGVGAAGVFGPGAGGVVGPGAAGGYWRDGPVTPISAHQTVQTSIGPYGERREVSTITVPGGVVTATTTIIDSDGETVSSSLTRTSSRIDGPVHTTTVETFGPDGALTATTQTTRTYDGPNVTEHTTETVDPSGRTTSLTTETVDPGTGVSTTSTYRPGESGILEETNRITVAGG